MYRILSYLLFFTLLFSAEFRVVVQTDGRTWYAGLFSISFSDAEAEKKELPPELMRDSSVYLSIQEAMYIRNRLEEILDDEEHVLP